MDIDDAFNGKLLREITVQDCVQWETIEGDNCPGFRGLSAAWNVFSM